MRLTCSTRSATSVLRSRLRRRRSSSSGVGGDGHGADTRLTALEREQRAQQRLSVEPVGFGVAPTPRRGDRRRINHVALDAFSLQQAMQPEAVESPPPGW